ncbi:MucR family transcriptional regulator [Mesorhizobium abyssinicae]|uniref:MucR family transcriptional regulator n=1 Tax=Mesorhizobium abyssinicae TaxID=1209958 RepID=UPI003391DBF4
MSMDDDKTEPVTVDVVAVTATIVAAFVRSNAIPAAAVPDLIASVSSALRSILQPPALREPEPVPAVNRKRSVFPDYIVCLEDGKKLKSLKRHLRARFSMTPEEYRAKWGLDPDYPMVAPNYAAQRSLVAKSAGFGRKPTARPQGESPPSLES